MAMALVDELHIAHGFRLRDLDQMTRAAAIADRTMALGYQDKKDIAWSAIAEALVTAQETPDRQALIRVGWQAIYRTVRDSYRSRGYNDDGEAMPRFAMFWTNPYTPSHEHHVVESIATHQVLDTLGEIYRDAIVALAAHGDYQRAAQSLGIQYAAFTVRLSTARRQLLALWHEGETPRRVRTTDRRVGAYGRDLATRCSEGHEWTPENTYIRHRKLRGKPHTSRVCRACEHDRSARRYVQGRLSDGQ
jgi:DNA-directed RNA polymerase specialized sigma24 family protein